MRVFPIPRKRLRKKLHVFPFSAAAFAVPLCFSCCVEIHRDCSHTMWRIPRILPRS